MAEFFLKNHYFEFNGQVKQQTIVTRFEPTYACIFTDDVESKFLETQSLQPLIWFRYIDDVFFIWTQEEKKLQVFLTDLNNYNPRIKFTFEFNKEHISFLDLKVSLCDGKLTTDLLVKPTDRHQYLYYTSAHPNIHIYIYIYPYFSVIIVFVGFYLQLLLSSLRLMLLLFSCY